MACLRAVGRAILPALTGAAALSCFAPRTERCYDPDWVCPAGLLCNPVRPGCVSPGVPICGDGIREGAEECDDGVAANSSLPDACRSDCTRPRCGDGVVDPGFGEVCDGALVPSGGPGCSSDCRSDLSCGNGITDQAAGEGCDDGNLLSRDGCSSRCGAEVLLWRRFDNPFPAGPATALLFDSARDRLLRLDADASWRGRSLWAHDGRGWSSLAPTLGPLGDGVAAVYDASRARVVVFGGLVLGIYEDRTWEFDGTTWSETTSPLSPPGRTGHVLCYDAGRGFTVLFGGKNASTALADTWEYDGDWTRVDTVNAPPARSKAAAAYDSARQRVVLFSGIGADEVQLADTWEYDGQSWFATTAVRPATPSPNLAYDAARALTVSVDGNLTWIYDGINWSVVTGGANAFPARSKGVLAFDPRAGAVVLLGGIGTSSPRPLRDMWSFDGRIWHDVTPTNAPPARSDAVGTFAARRGELLLYGGSAADGTMLADTWRWDGLEWRADAGPSPPPRGQAAIAYDPAGDAPVLFGGHDALLAARDDTWTYGTDGWSRVDTAIAPPARWGHALASDRVGGRVLLFGGRRGSTTFGDTWYYAAGQWQELTPTASPPPRYHHRMAPLPREAGVLLIGGRDRDNTFSDTWVFAAGSWQRHPAFPTGDLVTRIGLDLDPYTLRHLLVGGHDVDLEPQPDAYWFDGLRFEPLVALGETPSARAGHLLVFDPERREMIVFGGVPLNDETWSLSFRGPEATEVCDSASDDDGDGLVDCADPDCRFHRGCAPAPNCEAARCADPVCGGAACDTSGRVCFAGSCVCPGGQITESACADGRDNDCDGLVDCADDDCRGDAACGP